MDVTFIWYEMKLLQSLV